MRMERQLQIIGLFTSRAFKILKISVVVCLIFNRPVSGCIDVCSAIADQTIAFYFFLYILAAFLSHTLSPFLEPLEKRSLLLILQRCSEMSIRVTVSPTPWMPILPLSNSGSHTLKRLGR